MQLIFLSRERLLQTWGEFLFFRIENAPSALGEFSGLVSAAVAVLHYSLKIGTLGLIVPLTSRRDFVQ